jgi:D-serine dehydratase
METLMVFPNLGVSYWVNDQTDTNHVISMNEQEECELEFGAFARGGVCGLARLTRVYPNIVKEFNLSQKEMEHVLWKTGLKLHKGKIKPL